MNSEDINCVMQILREDCRHWPTPSVTVISEKDRNPFTVLISCIISLRTKDAVTAMSSARLFAVASSPLEMLSLTVEDIAGLIYPAGFYRNKARQIRSICEQLVSSYSSIVPDEIEQLLTFKGVGRKTANLVVTLGYGKPGICVDTHVHRITNRWGYLCTKTPEQTEQVLRSRLPEKFWIEINDLLVCYGQNRCFPVSPACSLCRIAFCCNKEAVKRSR